MTKSSRFWIVFLILSLSFFYIYWEIAHMVSRNWDQDVFLYLYNDAFLELFRDSKTWPLWNPYIQSGITLTPNTPFLLSLSKITTLAVGRGDMGLFLSRALLLSIAGFCLFGFMKRLGVGLWAFLPSFFLFLEYQLGLNSHESLPTCVAAVLFYASLCYDEKSRFYTITLSALYLGIALNFWVPHAILAILPLQLLFLFFLRGRLHVKHQLFFMAAVWGFGFLLSLPTLVPLMAEAKTSQKILQYASEFHPGSVWTNIAYFINNGLLMRLSAGMVLLLAMAIGLLPFFWKDLSETAQAFVKALAFFFLLLRVLLWEKRSV